MAERGERATRGEAKKLHRATFRLPDLGIVENNQNPLRDPGFWLTATDDSNAVGRERRLRPCEHQLKQDPLLFLGFGLGDPKQGLFGILPELIRL
jgi:hypothetical protein